MIRRIRDFRLIPVVLIATICLFALKTLGLVFDGGYVLGGAAGRPADETDITGAITAAKNADVDYANAAASPSPRSPQTAQGAAVTAAPARSWAREMFNFPDVTGSVGETKAAPPAHAAAQDEKPKAKPKNPPPVAGWKPVAIEAGPAPSSAERAILDRLSERRGELDNRAKEIEMRENLLKAAEKRLEARIAELKELEDRVNAAAQIKEGTEAARFKNLVTMYENMKAKDAAKIFDRLDLKVLVDVSTKINPRRMSDILAQMAPEAAERLTVELAGRGKDKAATADLPKIEGHPTAN
jgi:flagellar motility protein MotE (MotC chaperone)